MTVLEDSYHLVTLDRQRDLVAERSLDFMDRLCRQLAEQQDLDRMRTKTPAE